MIGTGEGYLVGLPLGLPLGSPLNYPNLGADMPSILMGVPLGLWFGSDMVWWLGIYFAPSSRYLITSKMNSVLIS